jgi:hypothetical protein
MKGNTVYKIPNGKLVKVLIEYNNNILSTVKITGDFFAYPEEAIEIIEDELRKTNLDKSLLQKKIQTIIEKNDFEFIGINAEGLAEGIMRCIR